jgi:hypothetical protein
MCMGLLPGMAALKSVVVPLVPRPDGASAFGKHCRTAMPLEFVIAVTPLGAHHDAVGGLVHGAHLAPTRTTPASRGAAEVS